MSDPDLQLASTALLAKMRIGQDGLNRLVLGGQDPLRGDHTNTTQDNHVSGTRSGVWQEEGSYLRYVDSAPSDRQSSRQSTLLYSQSNARPIAKDQRQTPSRRVKILVTRSKSIRWIQCICEVETTCTCLNSQTQLIARTPTSARARAHAHTHTHARARTHTHMHTHVHTHQGMHTGVLKAQFFYWGGGGTITFSTPPSYTHAHGCAYQYLYGRLEYWRIFCRA